MLLGKFSPLRKRAHCWQESAHTLQQHRERDREQGDEKERYSNQVGRCSLARLLTAPVGLGNASHPRGCCLGLHRPQSIITEQSERMTFT